MNFIVYYFEFAIIIFTDTFFLDDPIEEQIFRATFRVIDGDYYTSELADPSTEIFKIRSREYKERLNLLFRRSPVRHGFAGTEILALDGYGYFRYKINKTIFMSLNFLQN